MYESISGIFFFFEQDTQYYSRVYKGAWPSYGWACYMGHRQHSHLAARARAHAHACRLHWFTRLVIHECGTRFCHSAFAVFAIKMFRQDVSKEIYRFSWEINFVNKKSIIYIYITYLIFFTCMCKFQIFTQTEWSSRLNTKTCLFFSSYMEIISIFRLLREKSSNSDVSLSPGLKIYRQPANIGEYDCDKELDWMFVDNFDSKQTWICTL